MKYIPLVVAVVAWLVAADYLSSGNHAAAVMGLRVRDMGMGSGGLCMNDLIELIVVLAVAAFALLALLMVVMP